MRKFLTALVVIPVAAILIVFALANRTPVVVSLDPFAPTPAWSVELPLFIVIIASVALGVLVGGIADWFGQSRYRREARHGRSEVRRLEQEAQALRRAQAQPQPAANLPVPYGE